MNLLKAICWVLGILIAAMFMPILIIIGSVILTIAGIVGAIYVVKAIYDLETEHAQFVRQMIEQQKGLNDEHEDPTTEL